MTTFGCEYGVPLTYVIFWYLGTSNCILQPLVARNSSGLQPQKICAWLRPGKLWSHYVIVVKALEVTMSSYRRTQSQLHILGRPYFPGISCKKYICSWSMSQIIGQRLKDTLNQKDSISQLLKLHFSPIRCMLTI